MAGLLCALAISVWCPPALAQSANSKTASQNAGQVVNQVFNAAGANSNQSCAILVSKPGTIVSSPDNMTLASNLAGGAPGTADIVTSNGSYSASIDTVTGFSSQPPGGSANTDFSSTYSGTGATAFAETPGNIPVQLKKGTTRVEANFIATRTAGPFPAGNYKGELVLRCE